VWTRRILEKSVTKQRATEKISNAQKPAAFASIRGILSTFLKYQRTKHAAGMSSQK